MINSQLIFTHFPIGIDDHHWKDNGTLLHVANITGSQFKGLAEYIHDYNQTIPFYETWRVRNSTDNTSYQEWFHACDCATYVQKVFCKAAELGASFSKHVTAPKYTFITLISDEPIKLGDSSMFEDGKNSELAKDIIQFYSDVQAHQPTMTMIENLLNMLEYVLLKNKFYLYYNGYYWQLPMKYPYVKLTYEPITFDYCIKNKQAE